MINAVVGQKMRDDMSLNQISQKDSVIDIVLNDVSDGIYIVDSNKKIIFWNKGAEEQTGYRREEVLGYRASEDILNHIDENGKPLCPGECPISKALLYGETVKVKLFPQKKSGKRFPIMSHISPIKNKEGKVVAAIEVFRDISKEEDYRILQEKFNNLIRKYVSTATIERVMSLVLSGVDSKTARREMTILYIDVVNFTAMSEVYLPEEVAMTLNEIFSICEIITQECYGDIDKFMGDAIMAVFIDAQDAVNAGKKILDALQDLNQERIRNSKEPVNVRIAINSGKVVQAEIGTIARKDLTVIGDVVNTTAHIEKLGSPNSIFLTEATLSRLKDPGKYKFERRILLKGKKEPVSLYSYTPEIAKERDEGFIMGINELDSPE